MASWLNAKVSGGNDRRPILSDLIHMPKLPKNETKLYRMIGPVHQVAEYWFEVFTKKGEGTARIRKLAVNFNSETGEFEGVCPYAEVLGVQPRVITFANAINRDVQEQQPKKTGKYSKKEKELVKVGSGPDAIKLHIKEKGSDIWTPVQAIRFPSSATTKVQDTSTTNKVVDKKTGEKRQYGPEHPKYGYDLAIKHNPDAKTPSDQYFIQKEARTKLTEEELAYCVQNIWLEVPEDKATAQREAEKFLKMGLVERDKDGKIINGPPTDGGGKKKDKKKPDYLGGLGGDDDKKKKKKKEKSDKGGKADKKKDKGGKAEKPGKDKPKDKSGKGDTKSDKKKDKGGKSKFSL